MARRKGQKAKQDAKEKVPTRIFKYGALAPTTGLQVIADQMHLAHEYRNVLVAAERKRRELTEAAVRRRFPVVADLENYLVDLKAEYKALETRARADNAAARSRRRPANDPILLALRSINRREKETKELLKPARKTAWQNLELKAEAAAYTAAYNKEEKVLRAASKLYWGTYLQAEAAHEQACKMTAKFNRPLRFRVWDGDGKVAVQIQHGMSVSRLMACNDNRLQLRPLPEDAFRLGESGWKLSQRSKGYTVLKLRIGSDKRDPVWAEIPVLLHRPLPEDAKIMWAWLLRRRVATHDRWSVQFVLTSPTVGHHDVARTGKLSVDVGWRMLEDGSMRIATWQGSDGDKGNVVIAPQDLDRWRFADSLQAKRDDRLNEIMAELRQWCHNWKSMLPEWLVEEVKTIHLWKGQKRLARLLFQWRDHRFDRDETMFDSLQSWQRWDRKKYEEEANTRRKAIAWRDDMYHRFARDMRLRYAVCIVENTNWRELQQRAAIGDEEKQAIGRHNFRVSSVGRFIEILGSSGMTVEKKEAAYTTMTCSACACVHKFDARRELVVTCPECGHVEDQDERAADNLMAVSD